MAGEPNVQYEDGSKESGIDRERLRASIRGKAGVARAESQQAGGTGNVAPQRKRKPMSREEARCTEGQARSSRKERRAVHEESGSATCKVS